MKVKYCVLFYVFLFPKILFLMLYLITYLLLSKIEKSKRYLISVVLFIIILFFIPIDIFYRKCKYESDFITEGEWIYIYESKDDSGILVKKFKDVYTRGSSTKKMLGFHPYSNSNFRNFFDLITWHGVIGPQWENIMDVKTKNVSYIKEVDEYDLSWTQERREGFSLTDYEIL